ncbi:superoxide dismutase [Candidatus Campbellbacteria bacterium]|nr:MAG: superoxide dismutase [Candidatus Campbellbacteria bacterium]
MFKRNELKYELNAFEGCISKDIMDLHYNKHHKAYTDNFNNFVQEQGLENKSIEEIFSEISEQPQGLINNAGGYFNHNFFWDCLTPNKDEQEISERLKEKIQSDFGTWENFENEFKEKSLTLFGSGWVSLVLDQENKLQIIQTQNQDCVLMDFVQEKYGKTKLVLTLDVWEHAYYLDYKNVRKDYVDNFFKIINWKFVEKNIFEL